ncbi:TPA: ABC transporter ATP-binding protein [candidate division CPR2 bacterium]|uniref:Multidrug ABC transporter,ATP-binding protein (ATPase) n=1 Tax=candidate division CPR2 bacterium GW2011_GWC1_41_48 TaxID=1618344 RepID=A0A0G0ZA02_UNCC2|nr:MAG: ABC transporter ATP binding protein [candidate division CPR2 bacterium GW2011_GWC2_39_35]KKS09878.1 MAG: Multidrug ABC transporter,ATP-binding protein (ATPase) [candidate division CPR2 bacterium GW2011_GWC1_41_48]HBG81672.1 ABC transporter ATP-binding protein [candidate division CPR2 bacterium]HCL99363.1 ABC transporter ATP-binding protein [candidate division CPR2 bacterium]
MAVIEVKNLEKHYGNTKAVQGICFDVEKGEVFGFLGPNGAGKTTTIRCIMDFVRPTAGNISVLELDTQANSEELKGKIGYLSGDVRLYENWTGEEHFEFIQNIRGKSKSLLKLAKDFDYNPKIKVKNLSSGNKQKLGLILAFMSEPEVLILDEPTTALDPLLQNAVYDVIKSFSEKGRTVFMSSHNLAEVERVCSRVGIIKQGKMITTENIQNLKGKKIHVVNVSFAGKFSKSSFKGDGISIQKEVPGGLVLNVKGDINQILREISKYEVKDVEINHASLEDIFLEYYERKENVSNSLANN